MLFIEHDLLSTELHINQQFDVVVSNPPYIPAKEMHSLHTNVVEHEPHVALFIDNEQPMYPFRAIANHAYRVLKPRGILIVEGHAPLMQAVAECFLARGLKQVEVLTDSFGRDRFVKAYMA